MCIVSPVMNEKSTNTSAPHHGITAEAISRRAYELWEHEGRPESRDLHHWLRAERELLAEQGQSNRPSTSAGSAQANTDTQPLQGTRAAAAANRGPSKKSGSTSPFEKSAPRSSQPGMRNGRM